MQTGKCKWYNDLKGYGFIERPGATDIFVHASCIRSRPAILKPGDEVAFNEEVGPRGPRAVDVTVTAYNGQAVTPRIPSHD